MKPNSKQSDYLIGVMVGAVLFATAPALSDPAPKLEALGIDIDTASRADLRTTARHSSGTGITAILGGERQT